MRKNIMYYSLWLGFVYLFYKILGLEYKVITLNDGTESSDLRLAFIDRLDIAFIPNLEYSETIESLSYFMLIYFGIIFLAQSITLFNWGFIDDNDKKYRALFVSAIVWNIITLILFYLFSLFFYWSAGVGLGVISIYMLVSFIGAIRVGIMVLEDDAGLFGVFDQVKRYQDELQSYNREINSLKFQYKNALK